MQANDAADLALIQGAVREAGAIARHYYGKDYRRWSKSRGEPVTEADIAIDRFLKENLGRARPSYCWLSEETGKDPARTGDTRLFIVDPIDGTTAFLKERPHFSISVAIADEGRPVVGVIYNPILDEFFSAIDTGGATFNGEPITVSGCSAIEGCRILGRQEMFESHAPSGTSNIWSTVRIESRSSIAYRMALVAAGRFDAAVVLTPKHDWDMAAGDVIVREAGGRVTSRDGNPLVFGEASAIQRSMVCAGTALHALLIGQLGHPGFATESREHARS